MARIALIDPSGRSTTTVQAVLGRNHEILVRQRIHAPGDCDLVIADLRPDDLLDTSLLRALGSFGPVLLLVERLQPIPVAVEESRDLCVLRKPFDAFELRLGVDRLLRAAVHQAVRAPGPARVEDEDAQWLEFPFVPAPAGAVLRRAARLAAPLWILGEPGTGRRRIAMAVCRAADQPMRAVTLFPDEHLAAVVERERAGGPFALVIPDIERRPLLEQERLALLLGGGQAEFRLIATAVEDAGEKVLAGAFSRSLYQQISGLAVQLSPLRERPVTIPPLVQALARRIGRRLGLGEEISFSPDAMARLQTYMWPGNVLELESVLNRTLVHFSEKAADARAIDADEILFMPDDVARTKPQARPAMASTLARLPGRPAPVSVARPAAAEESPAAQADIRHVIAGLAHDLRNPMTTIKTFASTVGGVSGDPEDLRRLGDLAGEACTRIDGFLDTLQRYVDLPAPSPVECDVAEVARRAVEAAGEELAVTTRMVIDTPLRARCDPEQLQYAIENLVAALRSEADEGAALVLRSSRDGLVIETKAGRGAAAKLRELLGEGAERAKTWRLLLAATVAAKNGFRVEEEATGEVLRMSCRPVRGEVEGRNEQAYRTDR